MADLLTRLLLRTSDFEANLLRSKKMIGGFEKRIQKFSKSVGSSMKFAGAAGAAVALGAALRDAHNTTTIFEKSLSSLQALTGVTTKEMSFFRAEAIRLGSSTTQTASQVADAFRIIGSQMPELLKSKTALSSVTEQAIILAEAAGLDVPTAAKALTGSLNQMGEGASRASDYINILAAASQQGSADIPYLNAAIEKAGGTSSAVGIKFNELVGAIETIAPKVTEASSAGLHLKNIFLTLESSADKNLKPSVVGLGEAITYLASKNLDATQMTKMFGKESVSAALALVGAKDNYLSYAESIKGTNTALEQQRINNTNLDGSIKSLGSAWEGLILTLNSTQGILMQATNIMTNVLNNFSELFKKDEAKQIDATREKTKAMLKFSNDRISQYEKEGKSRKEAMQMVLGENDMVDNRATNKYQIKKTEAEERLAYNQKLQPGTNVKGNKKVYYDQGYIDNMIDVEKEVIRQCNAELEARKAVSKELSNQIELIGKKKVVKPNVEETEEEKKIKANAEVELKFRELDDERIADWINKSIHDIQNYAVDEFEAIALPLGFELEPEALDLVGSIADLEQQIQDVTELYNEATTEALRAQYATRKEELEAHLNEMQGVNDKLIDVTEHLNGLVEGVVMQSLTSMGDAIGGGSGGDVMRSMLIGMMDMLQQFGKALVAAGLAKLAFDKLLAMPGPATIAAGAALVVATSIAKSKLQSAGSFAQGGIIGGASYSGDRLTANVNSGEMILNNQQQGRLFQLANGVYNHIPLSPPPSFTREGMVGVQPFSDGSNISKILSTENQNRVDRVEVSGLFRVKGQDLEAAIGNRVRYRSRIK